MVGFDYWQFLFDSTVAPNSRPYLQYNGELFGGPPSDLVAAGIPNVDMVTLAAGSNSRLQLRRKQIDLFSNASRRRISRLSMTLGARLEINTLPTSCDGRFESAFNEGQFVSEVQQDLTTCGSNDMCSTRVSNLNAAFVGNYDGIFSATRVTVDPRIGLAWDIRGNATTLLRAGFGRYTTQFPAAILDESRSAFPLSFPLNFAGRSIPGPGEIPHILNGILTASEAAPLQAALNSGAGQNPVTFLSQDFTGTLINSRPSDHLLNPYAFQYGVTVEQRLPWSGLLSVAWVGTNGTHLLQLLAPRGFGQSIGGVQLFSSHSFAGLPEESTNSCTYLPYLNGIPQEPPIFYDCGHVQNILLGTGGSSVYQSLQSEFRAHVGRASLGSAFTWGYSIDDASDFFDSRSSPAFPQDSNNARADRGPSDFDVRRRLVTFFDWQPIQPGKTWRRRWAGGWRLAGIHSLQSGVPFTVNTYNDSNVMGY